MPDILRPEDAIAAASTAEAALRPVIDRDWSVRAGPLEWSVEQTITHMIAAAAKHTLSLASRSERFIGLSVSRWPDAANEEVIDSLVPVATGLANVALVTPPGVRAYHATGPSTAADYVGRACVELLVHTDDALSGFGVAFAPPADLCQRVLSRQFPNTEADRFDPPGMAYWPPPAGRCTDDRPARRPSASMYNLRLAPGSGVIAATSTACPAPHPAEPAIHGRLRQLNRRSTGSWVDILISWHHDYRAVRRPARPRGYRRTHLPYRRHRPSAAALAARPAWRGPVWRWISLIALLAALGLVILDNARLLTSADDQGRPTTAQVDGTWTDGDRTAVRVLPDGTFTAAGLPADPNDPAAGRQPDPANGRGTWRFSSENGVWYVLFTLSGGSQFQFYVWNPTTTGGSPPSAVLSYATAQGSPENVDELFRR